MNSKLAISIEFLEFFCQCNQLLVGFGSDDEKVWISALGPHPSDLTAAQIHRLLEKSKFFLVRRLEEEDEAILFTERLSRKELQQRLSRLLN